MSTTYLRIAGEISQATLLADGEEPEFWEVDPVEFNQLISELDPPSLPIVVLGVPITLSKSSLGEMRQAGERLGLNEDRAHASATGEQASSGDLGASADSEKLPWE